jgi:hypothetical protein
VKKHIDVLERDHVRLMDPRVARIDWARSGAKKLFARVREAMADHWRASMEAEHRSAGIFATFVLDLMGAGAPPRFLSAVSAAILDEVRHAELCARLCACYSAQQETPSAGIPRVPDQRDLDAHEQALFQALFLSVAAETFSSVMLADVAANARDPVVSAVTRIVLADEVRHARLGWSYLGHRLADPAAEAATRAFVKRQLVRVFDMAHGSLFGDANDIPPPSLRGRNGALATAHGYRPARENYRLFLATIPQVWIPAFARLGFDATVLATRYPKPRWV